jgi:hypothetical protein
VKRMISTTSRRELSSFFSARQGAEGQICDFFFLSSLQKLEQRAKKCIERHWEYVE